MGPSGRAKVLVIFSFQGTKENISRGGRVGNKREYEERDETIAVYVCDGGGIRAIVVALFRKGELHCRTYYTHVSSLYSRK